MNPTIQRMARIAELKAESDKLWRYNLIAEAEKVDFTLNDEVKNLSADLSAIGINPNDFRSAVL